EILLEPTAAEREDVQAMVIRRHRFGFELESHAGQPSVTPDGHHVALMGNVDLPEEIDAAQRHGAQGVGLVRTEFLMTGRTSLPSEEEQYLYFRRLAAAFRDWPVIIRSFDLGGDKFPPAFQPPAEMNPFLGWRSIRVCLDRPEIFRPQLRAVLRAAVDQNIWLMLPLITSVAEVQASRALMLEEAENLAREGIRAAASVKVGVMVETPSAVLLADRLALVSDFFSVGTNDLTQYTLAVDRGNARLSGRFESQHPAILRQLKMVIDTAKAFDLPAGVCGEMASDPLSAVLLMGLGYTSLSVSPQDLPVMNWVVRNVPLTAGRKAADLALRADSAETVREAILGVVRDHIDPRFLSPFTMLPGPTAKASLPHNPPPRS
ncbi:MAG: phosphoenolpyruvate--protein phosphotransferase, partial [Gemmatimonadales bacterium]